MAPSDSLKIGSCRFEGALWRPDEDPRAPGPLVVFLGRSNVGKSSWINRLLGRDALARTSARPGCTRAVHLYRVNESFYFVDLPGYGYAEVSRAVRRRWGRLVEGFLERQRERIARAIVLVDARHGPRPTDRQMRAWLEVERIPYLMLATKADKLSNRARAQSLRLWQAEGVPVRFVSALTGEGVRETWKELDRALAGARAAGGGRSGTSGGEKAWTFAN